MIAAPRFATVALALSVFAPLGCAELPQDEAELGRGDQALRTPPPWHDPVSSDGEKRELTLDLIERFIPHAESFFRPSDLREPRTDYYAAGGPGVTQPRGAGNIAFAVVTLLEARPDQATFGGVSRDTLVDHVIQSIRHEAFTNALSGADYERWGGGSWPASLETYSWAFAAWRLWAELDDETRALVERVVTAEANLVVSKPIASGEEQDTGAEDNAWNCTTPALAAVMFPEHERAPEWRQTVIRLALNASSTAADASSNRVVDGQPLSSWMVSVNLHPDLTLENHGFFSPIDQMVTHVGIGDAAIAYAAAGLPLPEALSFRTEQVWTDILMHLATDAGDLALPAGQDWTNRDFQHLEYLSILATRFQRPDAALFESRALELVARRASLLPSGALLGQAELGNETTLLERLAALHWQHRLFGPSPTPSSESFGSAFADARGAKQFPHSDFVAGRLRDAFVSMSWDPARPTGLVIPHAAQHAADPIFADYAPGNLVGAATGSVGPHHTELEGDGFSSAGSIGTRHFAMTAFGDGITLLLDRGTGATFTYALEDIPGVTGARPIWTSAGPGLGDLPGNWVNAADRLGMIVRGGAGLRAARMPGAEPRLVITGSVDTGSGQRGAVLLPLVDHDTTAELEPYVEQLAMPSDWSALSARAPDGSLRLATARFAGFPVAELALEDERGAPVPAHDAVALDYGTRFSMRLQAPSARGQVVRFFVRTPEPLGVVQLGEHAARLRNGQDRPVTAQVSYASPAGERLGAERTLGPGEEVQARLVAGALTLGGPELEALAQGSSELDQLLGELEAQREACERRGARAQLRALENASGELREALDSALDASQAPDPGRNDLSEALRRAERASERLEGAARGSRLPSALRLGARQLSRSLDRQLAEARAQSSGLALWMEPLSRAQPGELCTLRVAVRHRGGPPTAPVALEVAGPPGWGSHRVDLPPFSAGDVQIVELVLTVPPDATPLGQALATVVASYGEGDRRVSRSSQVLLDVDPVLDLLPATQRLPLAKSGSNQAELRVVNHADHELALRLGVSAPSELSARLANPELTLPAFGSDTVLLTLAGSTRRGGTEVIDVSATTAAGASVSTPIELFFSSDLARNAVGAPFPLASASASQGPYPPSLATDGDDSTFWVSGGSVAGEGPSPESPQFLGVDLGLPTSVSRVVMRPRPGYGPAAFSVEVSDDGSAWREVAAAASAPDAAVTRSFEPITTRFVRLRITGGHDRIQPPRNVQVASFEVYSAR